MKTGLRAAAVGGALVGLALAMASPSAWAATNLNSSKSNTYKAVAGAEDEQACVKAGGTVVTQDGKKVCALPAPAPAQ